MTTKPADSDPRFHGRRRGRKLRPGRELLLETVLPELSIVLPEGDGPVDPHIWFPAAPQKVWLEIGFGAGEHLAWQAAENPDVGMVGAEPYLNGVARLLSEIIERDLQNICLLADDVRPLLARLSAASLARVFVLFPDPWPKTKHHKRRLIQQEFLQNLTRVMLANGILHLASDWQPYIRFMLKHVAVVNNFIPTNSAINPLNLARPPTRFEQRGLQRGHEVTDLIYQLEK